MEMAHVILTDTCIFCGNDGEIELTNDQFKRYNQSRHPSGPLIQDALPELTDGQREQLMTGIHDECWDGAFA